MDSIVALLLVYVDDLLITGSDEVLNAMSKAIEGVWTIPSWTRAHVEGIRFCGLEVVQGAGPRSLQGAAGSDEDFTIQMHQQSYIKSLLDKHAVTEMAASPLAVWTEPEPDANPDLGLVRQAQGLCGTLTWLSFA